MESQFDNSIEEEGVCEDSTHEYDQEVCGTSCHWPLETVPEEDEEGDEEVYPCDTISDRPSLTEYDKEDDTECHYLVEDINDGDDNMSEVLEEFVPASAGEERVPSDTIGKRRGTPF
jgi:hypothetical protein